MLQAVTTDDVTNEAFPYMTAQVIALKDPGSGAHKNSVMVWAQRVSYAGELGWELYVDSAKAPLIWDALIAAGDAYGIRPVGYKALDSLRLEKGYRMWGTDITPDENPYEAGLGFCVRLKTGGDFVGRGVLQHSRENGPTRQLSTLTVENDSCVIYGGEAVYAGRHLVGRVRSGAYGYTVGVNIALTYLPLELAIEGTELQIEMFGELIPAREVEIGLAGAYKTLALTLDTLPDALERDGVISSDEIGRVIDIMDSAREQLANDLLESNMMKVSELLKMLAGAK